MEDGNIQSSASFALPAGGDEAGKLIKRLLDNNLRPEPTPEPTPPTPAPSPSPTNPSLLELSGRDFPPDARTEGLPPASPEDGEADGAGSAGGGSDEGPSSPRTYTYSVSAEGFRPLKKIS